MNIRTLSFGAAFLMSSLMSAQAEELTFSPSSMVEVTGGFGISAFSANELVFSGANTSSHLIWKTMLAPTFSAGVDIKVRKKWRITLSGETAWSGDGHMQDFDWISPYATGFGPNDWSHFSDHPDTGLNHYFSVRGDVAYEVAATKESAISIGASIRYTDVEWIARGGTFNYSKSALRDTFGVLTPGVAGITYRQQLPMVMIGPDFVGEKDAWRISGQLRGGVVVGAKATDDHWLRDLHFEHHMGLLPVVSADVKLSRKFGDKGEGFISVSALKVFTGVGDETATNTATSASATFPGRVGLNFLSARISAGLTGHF